MVVIAQKTDILTICIYTEILSTIFSVSCIDQNCLFYYHCEYAIKGKRLRQTNTFSFTRIKEKNTSSIYKNKKKRETKKDFKQ